MEIQEYTSSRANEIAELFHKSVHSIDSSVYSQELREAWAPTPVDYKKWHKRLDKKQPLMAIIDNRVAGFIELESDGHIDCMYTHPAFQSRGVGSSLYKQLESKAISLKLKRLYVEASLVAKPLFIKQGFKVTKENVVIRNKISLINYSMEKHLTL